MQYYELEFYIKYITLYKEHSIRKLLVNREFMNKLYLSPIKPARHKHLKSLIKSSQTPCFEHV